MSVVVCVICPFADDEKLKNIHVNLASLALWMSIVMVSCVPRSCIRSSIRGAAALSRRSDTVVCGDAQKTSRRGTAAEGTPDAREIMWFIGKPKGRSKMISNMTRHSCRTLRGCRNDGFLIRVKLFSGRPGTEVLRGLEYLGPNFKRSLRVKAADE